MIKEDVSKQLIIYCPAFTVIEVPGVKCDVVITEACGPFNGYQVIREVKNEIGTANAVPYNQGSLAYRKYWAADSRELDQDTHVTYSSPDYPDKFLYKAKLDGFNRPVVVKFVSRYHAAAHRFLAEHGLAPSLHYAIVEHAEAPMYGGRYMFPTLIQTGRSGYRIVTFAGSCVWRPSNTKHIGQGRRECYDHWL